MSIDLSDLTPGTDPGAIAPALPAPVVLARDGADPSPAEAAGIPAEARRRIGRNLRLLYAEVLSQPLPERFDALLADLATRTDPRGTA